MHKRFEEAVNSLGLEEARPLAILEIMKVPGLTKGHVKSHLQKYRQRIHKDNPVPAIIPWRPVYANAPKPGAKASERAAADLQHEMRKQQFDAQRALREKMAEQQTASEIQLEIRKQLDAQRALHEKMAEQLAQALKHGQGQGAQDQLAARRPGSATPDGSIALSTTRSASPLETLDTSTYTCDATGAKVESSGRIAAGKEGKEMTDEPSNQTGTAPRPLSPPEPSTSIWLQKELHSRSMAAYRQLQENLAVQQELLVQLRGLYGSEQPPPPQTQPSLPQTQPRSQLYHPLTSRPSVPSPAPLSIQPSSASSAGSSEASPSMMNGALQGRHPAIITTPPTPSAPQRKPLVMKWRQAKVMM